MSGDKTIYQALVMPLRFMMLDLLIQARLILLSILLNSNWVKDMSSVEWGQTFGTAVE